MSTLRATFDDHAVHFQLDDDRYTIPVGVHSLAAMLGADPPAPEELTNAIGLVADHLEDVTRELPGSAAADIIEISGIGAAVVADVEVGASAPLPFLLTREAAEDVFRTLATEAAADRTRNPGLPADMVHTVLGTCCAIVGVIRSLHASSVTVVAG
jgi:exopolyphosphatase/guanosine-5'-triphosphate,3'-diphosphate pyrophosphatase